MRIFQDSRGIYNLTMIIITIVCTATILGALFLQSKYLLALDYKWFQTAGFFVVALIAQIFFKLNDTKEQSKVLEAEFDRIQNDIAIRVKTVLKVLIFYFFSSVVLSAILSTVTATSSTVVINEVFKRWICIIALSFSISWLISILNAYMLYIEIADLKAEIANRELSKEGQKKFVERLTGKAK